jgi:hypothetical protein
MNGFVLISIGVCLRTFSGYPRLEAFISLSVACGASGGSRDLPKASVWHRLSPQKSRGHIGAGRGIAFHRPIRRHRMQTQQFLERT